MVNTVVQNNLPGADRTTRLDMAGADTLTVNLGALFSVISDPLAVRFNGAVNGAVINNSGTIEAIGVQAEQRAIRFETSVGATLNVTINNIGAASVIHAVNDAIEVQAGTVTAGQVTIANAGAITSNVGEAIDFSGTTGTFVTALTNSGTITAEVSDAIRLGAAAQITNTGTISGGNGAAYSDDADGIQLGDGASATINNTGGTIIGDGHGIRAGVGTNVTINNGTSGNPSGTIEGRNGAAIQSGGDVTIVNYGVIRGNFIAGLDVNAAGEVTGENGNPDPNPDGTVDYNGNAVIVSGRVTVDNYGDIFGSSNSGHDSNGLPNTAYGIRAGGGTINNYGPTTFEGGGITSGDVAILIDNGAGGNSAYVTHIYNAGRIFGVEMAVDLVSAFDDTLRNAGLIESGAPVAIRFGSGNNTFGILNGSQIIGATDGGAGFDTLSYAQYTAGGVTVTMDSASGGGLTVGLATGTNGVANFERVIGSAQNDTLSTKFAAMTFLGGAGTDTLNGGTGNDTLDGGTGADAMAGGGGSDIYFVDNAGDTVTEGNVAGVDTVNSSISFVLGTQHIENLTLLGSANIDATGNGLANLLIGNSGDNTLNGDGGADTMQGRAGNDLYGVHDLTDVVDESVAGSNGIDTVNAVVTLSLLDAAHFKGDIENVTLYSTGNISATGNNLANVLIGNSGNNTLNGNGGADTMQGLAGNDLYGVHDATDIVDESVAGSGGIDTVNAVVTLSLLDAAHFKGDIENVTLLGTGNINATGNNGANVLIGNSGNNTLNGNAGADTMRGMAGNDLYGVHDLTDIVDESVAGSAGIDTINSMINISLVAVAGAALGKGNIENIALLGSAHAFAYGNGLGNVLSGNSGSNVLAAGLGNDTLTGGGGNDFFLFNTALNATTNVDTITDMNASGDDTIRLENAIFTALAAGTLAAGAFRIGTGAVDADDRIIYDSANGSLLYDADGNAAGGAVKFAQLGSGLALTALDFQIV